MLCLTYKILKFEKPEYLYEMFVYLRNVHLRNTRFGEQTLSFPIHRTVIYTKSFHVSSVRLMNSLNQTIRNIERHELFVKKLKELFLKRYE